MQEVILGAGMAGLGAAYRLRQEGVPSVLYDKLAYHGGHAASFIYPEGFIFDDGPHISFTKDERLRELFAASAGGEFEAFRARVDNYWQGYWIKHPAQCNLYGLPEDLIVKVMLEFVAARHAGETEIRNYADWLYASYGKTFSEAFPMCYTRKFHTTPAENLGIDWLGPRLYRPELEEVFRGAITPLTEDVHYVSAFRYPTRGGFAGFLKGFASQSDVRLEHEVVSIDPRRREVRFASGETARYAHLISSLPLPELLPLIQGAPHDVQDAASRLAATECVIVNIGLDREDVHDAHWTYFYDEDIFFTRLSFPHLYSPNNAPPGAGSIQAEVYFSRKYKPRDVSPEACIEPVIRDLRRCGLIRDEDTILFRNARLIPYANVIFDLERAAALDTVHGYLDDIGIRYCGRYGEWGYHWTDDAFKSGEKAAAKALGAEFCGQGIAP